MMHPVIYLPEKCWQALCDCVGDPSSPWSSDYVVLSKIDTNEIIEIQINKGKGPIFKKEDNDPKKCGLLIHYDSSVPHGKIHLAQPRGSLCRGHRPLSPSKLSSQ